MHGCMCVRTFVFMHACVRVGVHQHACICVSPERERVGVLFCNLGCVRVCVSVCPLLINDSVSKISIKSAFIRSRGGAQPAISFSNLQDRSRGRRPIPRGGPRCGPDEPGPARQDFHN